MTNETKQITFKDISSARAKRRIDLIARAVKLFLADASERNKTYFTKGELMSALYDKRASLRASQRIAKQILTALLSEGKIKESREIKKAVSYQTQILGSNDYGSFRVLMLRNKNKPRNKQGCYSYSGTKSIRRRLKLYTYIIYEIVGA